MTRKITFPRSFLAGLAVFYVLTLVFFCGASAQTYNAGSAMKAVEVKDDGKNPNGPWSYGQKFGFEGSDLTLLDTHQSDVAGDTNFPGWVGSSHGDTSILTVRVNIGASETIGFVWGAPGGPFMGDGTPDIVLHPSGVNQQETHAVVRWTAPAPGTYRITASWRDISAGGQNGSEGADVHLVVNGESVFDGIVSLESGPESVETTHVATLSRGDFVDFVVGPNANGDATGGSADNDGTAFNASISLVPRRMP